MDEILQVCYYNDHSNMTMVNCMHQEISKSNFKAHALEVMRGVEQTGNEVVITAHGKPTLIVKKYSEPENDPLARLKGSVINYDNPTMSVAEDDWEQA